MQWRENGIILSSKAFRERFRIVSVFNKTFGKTSGLLRDSKITVQPGDISDIYWMGRTTEQLGTFKIENIFSPFSHVFDNSIAVFAVESICFLCSSGLPENAPHPGLFDAIKTLLLSIYHGNWLVNYVFFEIKFLSEVGSGLDLSKCALTGSTENLWYISPRSGCAATRDAGEKYHNRLFILPQFLLSSTSFPSDADIFSALTITGHFLKMYFCDISNGKLPVSRDCLMMELAEKVGVGTK
ncbi:MAG: DNA repair protein RecO [Holosporaceae bacterium]|nr:DNA repair protein RecO [Holosporaceae bacterium]